MQFWQNQYRNFTIKGILWEISDDGAEVLLHTEMKCSIGAEVFTIVKKCRNKLKVSKQQKKLQKLLKSKREIVKSFKTFLGNCDILKNSPNSVEKFSYRLKNVPKDYG